MYKDNEKKQEWLDEIKKNRDCVEFETHHSGKSFALKAPKFHYKGWLIGTEKISGFKSVVFNWIGEPKKKPLLPLKWEHQCKNDKRWEYRTRLEASGLAGFLAELDEYKNF